MASTRAVGTQYWTQRLEIVEKSREGEKMLTAAPNPVGKGVGEGLYITRRRGRRQILL